MKIKKVLLFGALISSPILAFADIKPEESKDSIISSLNQNIEQNVLRKELINLHSEGAISRIDKERLLNNLSGENPSGLNLKPNSDYNEIKVSNLKKSSKVELEVIESENLIKLNLINANKIINSVITKSSLGWQIVFQLPEDKEIYIGISIIYL